MPCPIEVLEPRRVLALAAVQLAAINPAGDAAPGAYVPVGSSVIFQATSPTAGREMYALSGSSAKLLKDINRGPADASPGEIAASGGYGFFAADDGSPGIDVWRTDGTPAGTRKLIDFGAGDRPAIERLAVARDRLIVVEGASRRVASYSLDGRDRRVLDVLPQSFDLLFFESGRSGILYGIEDQDIQPWDGPYEQLRSDGFSESAVFHDDFTGPYFERGSFGDWIATGGGYSTVFRNAATGATKLLDGTLFAELPGGRVLAHIDGELRSYAGDLESYDRVRDTGHIGSIAVSGTAAYYSVGPEIWRTDGTSAGTYRLATVPGRIPGLAAQVKDLRAFGSTITFTTEGEGINATGRDLRYMSAEIGASAGVVSIPRKSKNAAPQTMVRIGGSLFFSAAAAGGHEPFRLDVSVGELAGGTLRVAGTGGRDAVTIAKKRVGGKWRVIVALNGRSESYLSSDARKIEIGLGDGDDRLNAAGCDTSLFVRGEGGNDSLVGGSGTDSLNGGAGKDTIRGGNGSDRLAGNGGSDRLLAEAGDDRLYGGDGSDYLDGGGNVDRGYGEGGNDTLIGGGSNDKLYGATGDDFFDGNAGADLIDGGIGRDSAWRDGGDRRIAIEVLK